MAIQEGWEENIDPLVFESILAAQPFQIYISLYKAFQKGIGEKFYQYIKDNFYLRETSSPEEALIKLDKLVYNFEKTPYQETTFDAANKFNYFDKFDMDEKRRKGKKIRKETENNWEDETILSRLANYLKEKGFIKEAILISAIKDI